MPPYTVWPAPARWRAAARPMPELAPVTTVTVMPGFCPTYDPTMLPDFHPRAVFGVATGDRQRVKLVLLERPFPYSR